MEKDTEQYFIEHHALTETAIGVAKLHLQSAQYASALKVLVDVCKDIDDITLRYQPATAQLMGLEHEQDNGHDHKG